MDENTYIELLDNNISNYQNKKIDLYITLLALNNSNYNDNMYETELTILEDFLRKINNLKVKIQLKRKEEEINNLLDNIKEIYLNNTNIINKYNKNNINIIYTLDEKETTKITELLDKLTKEKNKRVSNNDYYKEIRNLLNNTITKSNYTVNDNNININNKIISIDEFYDIFSYLLNIDNYKEVYQNKEINELHNKLIKDIIDILNNTKELEYEKIPMILTHILTKQIQNYELINTESFTIENIKITDLYSFANNNQLNEHTAKWQKIKIPNKYLYKKLKESIFNGMYYIKDNIFIIETNDFKTSININKLKEFIKDNLNKIV